MAATAFGVAMLLLTTRELLRKRIRLLQYSFWLVLWLALILMGTVPQFYSTLLFATQALGMYTPIHFVTTFSVLMLFAAVYFLEKRIAELNEKMNRIAQHIALLNADKEIPSTKKQE